MDQRLRPLRLALTLAFLAAAAVVLWRWLDSEPGPQVPVAETALTGSWELDLAGMSAQQRERLAAELSLPYSSGSQAASGRSGVVFRDPQRSAPGLNFYVSGHGPEALLMDATGRTLHRWRMPFERAFPGRPRSGQTSFWRRAILLPDGSVVALFQGSGLVRVDATSHLVWTQPGVFFNHLTLGADGHIYTIVKDPRQLPELRPAPVLEDFIAVLDPADGHLLRRISLLEALRRSPYQDLLSEAVDYADIFHTNTVWRLDGDAAATVPAFAAGNLLVSLRELDTVAVLDPQGERFLWAWRGPWHRQHQPVLLPDGQLLLFDNRGNDGQARLLRLDPASRRVVWQFPPAGQPPLRSMEAGSCQLLANGNYLVTESSRGRAFELDPGRGEVVWEFLSPHRAGDRRQLVATLFEVVRLTSVPAALGVGAATGLSPERPGD